MKAVAVGPAHYKAVKESSHTGLAHTLPPRRVTFKRHCYLRGPRAAEIFSQPEREILSSLLGGAGGLGGLQRGMTGVILRL